MTFQQFIDCGQLGTAVWLCLRLERLLKHVTRRVDRIEDHLGIEGKDKDAAE